MHAGLIIEPARTQINAVPYAQMVVDREDGNPTPIITSEKKPAIISFAPLDAGVFTPIGANLADEPR